jgi:hypothetical protein
VSAGRGGLAVRLDEDHHYAVEAGDGAVRVVARIGPLRNEVAVRARPPGPVVLRVGIVVTEPTQDARTGPDTVRLGIETDGEFQVLAELDGKYLSTEVAGGFTGRLLGLYAAAGTVSSDWFDLWPD